MSEKFRLNDHVFRLLQKEPFFASLSRRVDKISNHAIPTAGVRVNPDKAQFELHYNPAYFEKLDDNKRAGVLIHEFYHLIFEHVTGRLPDELAGAMTSPTAEQQELFKYWNIATDLSINCHIGMENLPEKCCFPGGPMFEDFASGESAEFYYAELKKKKKEQEEKEQQGQPGDGEGDEPGGSSQTKFDPDQAGQFDDHAQWGGNASDAEAKAVQEIAAERLKEALKQAAQEAAQSNGWGSVSSSVRKRIMEAISTKVDWRKVLRYFVKTSQRADRRSTPKRLNRRYAYIHPGRKVNRTANIAISIDQSGSVSDQMLAAFYAELNKLADIASFTVVPFDTRVAEDKVYRWKRGESRRHERVLYGGTDFNAPTEYVNQRTFDAHILLTDMCAPKPKTSKCPRMWMTDKHHAKRPYFKTTERVVAIDV